MPKIHIHNSTENVGPLDRCPSCNVEQPDYATPYESWHMDDCQAIPLSGDLEERLDAHMERNVEELKPDL